MSAIPIAERKARLFLDTATAFVPLIGIIDQRAFRIVANYKQDYVRFFTVGETA